MADTVTEAERPKGALSLFEISRVEAGWADVTIRDGQSEFTTRVSDLTDGLGEFAISLEAVVSRHISGCECRWEFEPGFHAVFIRYHDFEHLELSVAFDNELYLRAKRILKRPRFEAIVSTSAFVQDALGAYLGLVSQFGHHGYYTRWNYPFPHHSINALRVWQRTGAVRRYPRGL